MKHFKQKPAFKSNSLPHINCQSGLLLCWVISALLPHDTCDLQCTFISFSSLQGHEIFSHCDVKMCLKCKTISQTETTELTLSGCFVVVGSILSYAMPLPGDPWARAALHQPGWAAGWFCGGGASRWRPGYCCEELPASTAHLEPTATGESQTTLTYKVGAKSSAVLRVWRRCLN